MFVVRHDKTYPGSDEYIISLEKATGNTLHSLQKKMKKYRTSTRKEISYMFWIRRVLRENVKHLVRRWKVQELCWTEWHLTYTRLSFRESSFTVYHDSLKACKDRKIPVWLQKCQNQLQKGENILQPSDEKINSQNARRPRCLNELGHWI